MSVTLEPHGQAPIHPNAATQSAKVERRQRYFLPASLSAEAAATLGPLYAAQAQTPASQPTCLADFITASDQVQEAIAPLNAHAMQVLAATLSEDVIAGLPVLRIKPAIHDAGLAPLVYIHGGGWVAMSAGTMTVPPALVATATQREVVSIDYTLAPEADFNKITDQIVAVWKALVMDGHDPRSMGLFGDSAGGNIALSSTLKMRDQDVPLPGALYTISPATDLTLAGETLYTLGDVDPVLQPEQMPWLRDAYVGEGDARHAYVSPVFGDFSKPFPPTLIQGGTREMLLSDSVRQYQAIRSGGHEAVLDLYEGMPHTFQGALMASPESKTAIARAAAFFKKHLIS